MNLIEIDELNVIKNNRKILENINLTINKGDFIILFGESGSGKSTLLNIIGGLEKVNSGDIIVNGIPYSKLKNNIRRDIVSYVFQNYALLENETIYENLKLVEKNKKKIEEGLKKFNLESLKLSQKVHELSGGEQQRVSILRSYLQNNELILADEPTGNLDYGNTILVMDLLTELVNNEGKTVLMVTHNNELITYGNRIMNIKKGKLYEANFNKRNIIDD